MKYVIVTGGVISGVGKGVFTSSIGMLLKAAGYQVNICKIDPYLNRDAGTMNPFEHGECFVLDDGMECDLDLGNYERFLEKNLSSNSAITSGQIYNTVFANERRGDYLGKTVQIVPHVTDEIIHRLELLAENHDYVVVELGGTVGDMESSIFYYAIRQLHRKYGRDNFYHVHVAPILQTHGNELKTKAAQTSATQLSERGIIPDYICLRLPSNYTTISDSIRDKLVFCCRKDIIVSPNCQSVYQVPELLYNQLKHLMPEFRGGNTFNHDFLADFSRLGNADRVTDQTIAVVGKYLHFEDGCTEDKSDAYLSLRHAIDHASMKVHNKLFRVRWFDAENMDLSELSECTAVIITGGFGTRAYENMINVARYCADHDIPTLGICLGFQVMVIAAARSLGFIGADTTEKNQNTEFPIIDIHEDSRKQHSKGGTLRKGSYYVTSLNTLPISSQQERFRHRYHLRPDLANILKSKSKHILFDGFTEDLKDVATRFSLSNKRYYIGTQAHCELTSRLHSPSEYFVNLMKTLY